jgi:cell division protease FtsH
MAKMSETDLEALAEAFKLHAEDLIEQGHIEQDEIIKIYNEFAGTDEQIGLYDNEKENEASEDVDAEAETKESDKDFQPKFVKDTGVSLKSVGGIHETKQEIADLVDFIHYPKKRSRLGGKLPKGILLEGPPGTGKTHLAKALAHEAGVPFLQVNGTDFEDMYYGVSKSRMKKVCNMAREKITDLKKQGIKDPSCIIFIDEIDIFAARRGRNSGDSVHESTLTELLVQMDGFEDLAGVTFLASTNRPDIIDPALLRPGRFGKRLPVTAPSPAGRLEILKILVRDKKVPLRADVDLDSIAKKSFGFTGADLHELVNEAALIAAKDDHVRKVGMKEFNQAHARVLKGPKRKLNMTVREKESTALHEAGHAIAGLLKEGEGMAKLRDVTIAPHVGSLGTTYFGDDKENYNNTEKKFKAELVVDYAGRIAEELAYGKENVSSGASGDIMSATSIAWNMVAKYGFNKSLGLLNFDEDEDGYLGPSGFSKGQNLDPDTARKIFAEMKDLTDMAYEQARILLTENYGALIALSQALMEHETLDRDQVIEITGIEPSQPKMISLKRLAEIENPPGLGPSMSPSQ